MTRLNEDAPEHPDRLNITATTAAAGRADRLLAQIGSFVPADRARIGLVDRIFTRTARTMTWRTAVDVHG